MLLVLAVLPIGPVCAQQLTPNAYQPSPVHANVIIAADNFSTGDVSLDPSLPVTDVHADINSFAVGFARTLGVYGHYANVGVVAPYVTGNLEGTYLGETLSVHKKGFADPQFRLAVDLYGAPAMTPKEFAVYHQHTIVGVSLVVAPPLGAYDNTKLINIGSNRWSFKPEIGLSRASGPWTLETDAGAWLFTDNTNFARGKVRAQDPIGAFQLHAIYTFRSRMWLALDGTYYTGGRTTINGTRKFDLQKNSRVGVTLSLPLRRLQSIKIAYSRGARTTIGGNFDTVGVSYQYAWIDH